MPGFGSMQNSYRSSDHGFWYFKKLIFRTDQLGLIYYFEGWTMEELEVNIVSSADTIVATEDPVDEFIIISGQGALQEYAVRC